jgi:hypothetical protein
VPIADWDDEHPKAVGRIHFLADGNYIDASRQARFVIRA